MSITQNGSSYTLKNHRLSLSGTITIDSLDKKFLTDTLTACTETSKTLHIHCENIEKVDSAGIALLLQYIKICRQQKKKCQIHNFPAKMMDLTALYLHPKQRSLFYDAQKSC